MASEKPTFSIRPRVTIPKTRPEINKNVHVLTMLEAQGVEFDLVCLVGIKKETSIAEKGNISPKHVEERKRMQKDLLYVALTRAITELHILGTEKLSCQF